MASPPSAPGYQASSTPCTLSSQGISTGLPVSSTTMVCGLAAATASMRASWPPVSCSGPSTPSLFHWVAKTTATSAPLARAAAAAVSVPSAYSTCPLARACMAFIGEEGWKTMPPPQPGEPLGGGSLKEPFGITWDEPPPEITPTSAWPPITAILPALAARGRTPPSFFKSTMPCSATLPETRESVRVSSPPGASGWS